MRSKITQALREERIDTFEARLLDRSKDLKTDDYAQYLMTKPQPIEDRKNEVTGY